MRGLDLLGNNDAIPRKFPREKISLELGRQESREVDVFRSTEREIKRAEKGLRKIAADEKRERVRDSLQQFFHKSVPRFNRDNNWVLEFAVAKGIESKEFSSDVKDAVPDDNKLLMRIW